LNEGYAQEKKGQSSISLNTRSRKIGGKKEKGGGLLWFRGRRSTDLQRCMQNVLINTGRGLLERGGEKGGKSKKGRGGRTS